MTFELFVTWILVGLLTGWLAASLMKEGGHGLRYDLGLGLLGGGAASGVYWAMVASPDAGALATGVIAFLGAGVVVVAQRKIWTAPA
jgi:uncharacterized membrane protein YeaQ/YmgE (transglycosylase-associated protein family)